MDWNIASDIATILGTIATTAMVILTYRTLKANKEQLEELKKQWDEEHKANIVYSILFDNINLFLKVENIGKQTAKNLQIEINDEFIDAYMWMMGSDIIPKEMKQLKDKKLFLNGGDYKIYPLCTKVNGHTNPTPLKLKISYNDVVLEEILNIDEVTSLEFNHNNFGWAKSLANIAAKMDTIATAIHHTSKNK